MSRPLLLLTLLTLIVACSSSAPRNDTSAAVAPTAADEWVCVAALDRAGWLCARGGRPATPVPAPASPQTPIPVSSPSPSSTTGTITPTPLDALPRDFFTIELAAFERADEPQAWLDTLGVDGLLSARVARDGAIRYVLLFGVYTDRAEAQQAADARPPALARFTPRVLNLGSLQDEMARAAE
jgi:septal ring-binding cell division protein DamX